MFRKKTVQKKDLKASSNRTYQKYVDFFNKYSLLFHAVMSIVICFIIETVSRHSIAGAFGFLYSHFLAFAYNALIVFASLTLVYLFKRRQIGRAHV